MSSIAPSATAQLAELVPVLRRVADLDRGGLARLRVRGRSATVLIRLPFDVLVARTIVVEPVTESTDATVGVGELLSWLDGDRADPPAPRDADWRGALPPESGWRRLDTVPDDVIRDLVRSGATALRDAADREGVPGAQPRAAVADALLDSVVLTVSSDGASASASASAELTLRTLGALVRMGFLSRESHAGVDVAGRWIRVAGEFGSVYAERPGSGLGLLTL